MSTPAAGNYVIYDRVLSPLGDKLAITYPGALDNTLTVTTLGSKATTDQIVRSQSRTCAHGFLTFGPLQWVLTEVSTIEGTLTSLTPKAVPTNSETGGPNQVAWGSNNGPQVEAYGDYVWSILSSSTGYTYVVLQSASLRSHKPPRSGFRMGAT